MIELLHFFGIPLTVAENIVAYGTTSATVVVIIIVLLILAKILVVPALTKSISKWIDHNFSRTTDIVDTINVMKREYQEDYSHTRTRQYAVLNEIAKANIMLTELISDNIGGTDDTLAMITFAEIIKSANLRMIIFYQIRKKTNHILEIPDLVKSRYEQKSHEIGNEISSLLSKYHYQTIPLSHFFDGNQSINYAHDCLLEMYDLQKKIALKQEIDYSLLTLEDIQNAFDRQTSKLCSAFKLWLKNKDNTYIKTKADYKYTLFKLDSNGANNELEFL